MTKTERLILTLLYKVLEKVEPEDGEHQRLCQEILNRGFSLHYASLYGQIEDEVPEKTQNEVIAILEMHRALNNAKGLTGIKRADLRFRGFDGNNEVEHLAFGTFLSRHGSFEETTVDNSHMPTLAIYRRQLRAWKKSADPFSLTKTDVERILAARKHPGN